MLSNEERKAIERIDYIQDFIIENGQYNADVSDMEYFSKILILIKKQSKEIEELKEKNRQGKMRIVQLENEITARIEDVNQYYTPNDKIKAKIEELENYYKELYKKDNSPNEFLIGQDCLSKLSILQEVKQSLLEKE